MFRRLVRSRDYLAASIEEPKRLADAAREAHLSPYHFHRLFRQTFGETPNEFLMRLRMDRAKELLVREQLSVTETCFAVGYESLGTFSRTFREQFGLAPSEFERSVRRVFVVPEIAPFRFVPSCFASFFGVRSL